MIKSLITPLLLFGLVTVSAPAVQAEATPEDLAEAGSMIQTLGDEAIAVLNDPNTTNEAQAEAFREMMRDALNLDYLARLALGRHWRTASPEERSAYLDVFDDYLLYTVTSRLTSEELVSQVVTSQIPAGKRDIFVDAEVTGAGDRFDVRWRLRRFDNGLKIINLQLETFSMMITTREEFAAVVSDKGMDGLVEAMLTKIEKMRSQT